MFAFVVAGVACELGVGVGVDVNVDDDDVFRVDVDVESHVDGAGAHDIFIDNDV